MIAVLLALLAAAEAPPAAGYEKYQLDSETTCLGKADQAFARPDSWMEGGFKYTVNGGRAEIRSVAPKEARLGLLAAIKDFSPDTLANLKVFVAPGYYDARYLHESAGCRYQPEDAQELARIVRGAPSPVVLVTHGPPRQSGRLALDLTDDGHNVGDPDLAVAIAEARINFGVFGHIFEAGGRATDLEGKKTIKAGQLATALFVNPGPAFADPSGLNGGGVSHGLAAILTIKNGKGEWQQVKPGVADPRARLVKHKSN